MGGHPRAAAVGPWQQIWVLFPGQCVWGQPCTQGRVTGILCCHRLPLGASRKAGLELSPSSRTRMTHPFCFPKRRGGGICIRLTPFCCPFLRGGGLQEEEAVH